MDEIPAANATEAQLAEIHEEVSRDPLLSLPEPLNRSSSLVRELEHDEAYLNQALSLFGGSPVSATQHHFKTIRYSRRDGNCFYRCVGYRLCELMVENPTRAAAYAALLQSREGSLTTIFGPFVTDFTDVLAGIFNGVTAGTMTLTELYHRFTSEDGAYIVTALRYFISAYLQTHEEEYQPFVEGLGYATIRDYCNAEVELVDHESDNVQLAAFAQAFDAQVNVYALDRNAATEVTEYAFNEEGNADGHRFVIDLLYIPGHYNLLGR